MLIDDDLGFVSSGAGDLGDVAGGVRRARVFAGHAGWGPGQLDDELEEESWIVEPPLREEIFAEDSESSCGRRCCAARAASTRCSRRCRRTRRSTSPRQVRVTARALTGLPRRTRSPVCEEYVPMPSDAHNFNYVESSIPEGMTLGEYRRARMNRRPKPVRTGSALVPDAARPHRLRLVLLSPAPERAAAARRTSTALGRKWVSLRRGRFRPRGGRITFL